MDSSIDRRVLIELFRTTNGPSWGKKDSWDTNATISSWVGVTTDEDGFVVRLDLPANGLEGAIPASLGQLTNLTKLDLSSNQLTGAIPDSLGQLTNLTWLNLSSNQLTVIDEEAARGLQRLIVRLWDIYLGNNPWTNPPAEVVDGGLDRIVGYWGAIERSGVIVSWKLKVVLVGAVKAGKTSLVNGMIHGESRLCHEDDRTKGVDVHVAEPCKPDAEHKLELVFWDFAGHPEYYSTHQVFLSKGALHLLVVDLNRFSGERSARGELVDVWLDALQCRVPGSNVLVVATQIDRLTGDLEVELEGLKQRVKVHICRQRKLLERARRSCSTSLDIKRGLIFHGVEAVSSARSRSLLHFQSRLSTLVHTKRGMLPSVGRQLPVSWVRVSVMLDAKRSGKDPILLVSRVGTVEKSQKRSMNITEGDKFLHRMDAIKEWSAVVQKLNLEEEIGSTEGNSEDVIFEDAVDQLVRQGTILDTGEILYLEPTWINELLRTILDHELDAAAMEDFWKDELETFSDGHNNIYFDLKKIHDNFPSTGILTVGYLRFLWRNVIGINDKTFFGPLLDTMSRCGMIFRGNPSRIDRVEEQNAVDDSTELFVPLHLPSNILERDLEELARLRKHQFRVELVYEIRQPYAPPGVLGLILARFFFCEDVEIRKCWSRGAAFTLGEVLVLLHLDPPSPDNKEAQITFNLFGERFISGLSSAKKKVEDEVKSVMVKHFRGLMFGLKKGYPREVYGMNALVARIDGFEAHLDREMSRLLQVLLRLEDDVQGVAKRCQSTFARLSKLQCGEVPYPSLVIVRPAAAVVSGGEKRLLRAMIKDLGRRVKKLVCKDMRLCFLCPYDFSEVPCGLDGNGYPFTATRDWVNKIRPALKVTAMLVKVAIKAASGLDVPMSEFLNGAKSYIGEEVADSVLDDGTIERVLDGSDVPEEEGEVKRLVGKAYEELKTFMEGHDFKDTRNYIHFTNVMQLVDNGDGGKIWVSIANAKLWEEALSV